MLYLSFIDYIGKSLNGENIYRFDFSETPEVVWGDKWNETPCSIIPTLTPDIATLSQYGTVTTSKNFNLAKYNSCFSMQDCIDGIIALLFTNPHDSDDLILYFGEEFDEVSEKLKTLGLKIMDMKPFVEDKTDEIIDATISALDKLNEDSEEDFDF